MKALGLYGAEDAGPGEAQEYLMEYRDFLRDGEVVQSVCPELDGECNDWDGYCGGCGGCITMQAVHYGYDLRTVYLRRVLTHELAWELALAWLEAELDLEDDLRERLAREAVEYATGRRSVVGRARSPRP